MHQHIFAPCPRCDRHVRLSDARCPFCEHALPARTVRVVRGEPTSRAAAIAVSTALAAACDRPATSIENAHTNSTEASIATAVVDSGIDPARSFSIAAEGATDAGPAQVIAVIADAAAFDAALAATSPTNPNDGTIANNPFDGLGLSGWGAAYGASPIAPDTRDIGRPTAEVSIQRVDPADARLRAMLSIRRGLLVMCYQRELLNDPNASGSMEVQFDVHSDGSTSGAVARSSSLSSSLVACVRGRFNTYRVAPSLAALRHVTVRYVFSRRR